VLLVLALPLFDDPYPFEAPVLLVLALPLFDDPYPFEAPVVSFTVSFTVAAAAPAFDFTKSFAAPAASATKSFAAAALSASVEPCTVLLALPVFDDPYPCEAPVLLVLALPLFDDPYPFEAPLFWSEVGLAEPNLEELGGTSSVATFLRNT